MNDGLPLFHSSRETESEGSVQIFDCHSVPIPPGTRARTTPARRGPNGLPRMRWWVLLVVLVGMAGLTGWFLGSH
jgi:hypothetical protein